MIIKKPIKIKWKGYTIIFKHVSIDPADRSVGIMSESIADFDIAKASLGKKKLTQHEINVLGEFIIPESSEKDLSDFEEKVFEQLYKLHRSGRI
jgi:hypothetical protein